MEKLGRALARSQPVIIVDDFYFKLNVIGAFMRNIFYFCVIIFTCVTFCGCQGTCLTFEGGYKDYAGSFTWCQDKTQSVDAGHPIMKDENGKAGLIVSADDLQVVNDELNKKSNTMSIKSSNPCLEFIQIVKRLKKQ